MGNNQRDLTRYEVDGAVALITWNRPERNNAWGPGLETSYFARLQQAADDPAVRVIVVHGAGKHFCPGTDVAALTLVADGDETSNPEHRTPQTFPMTIPKPILAAIHGACAGTGFIQAAVADIRFAEPDARITPAFARRGILAEHGLAVLMPRLMGLSRSVELLFSARIISGREAHELGFINHLAHSGPVLDTALEYARDMAERCSPLALALTKRQVYQAVEHELENARREALALWRHLRRHEDFAEGVSSFREGRAPHFASLTGTTYQSFLAQDRGRPYGHLDQSGQ
jgi:enoyl-CoA hydratase/carnithine racemase